MGHKPCQRHGHSNVLCHSWRRTAFHKGKLKCCLGSAGTLQKKIPWNSWFSSKFLKIFRPSNSLAQEVMQCHSALESFFFLIKMKCAFWGRINVLVQMCWQLQNLMDRGSRRPIVICNLGSVCTPERQTINIKSYLLQTEDLYCTTFTHIHKNTIYI